MTDDRVPDVGRGPTRPLSERAARLAARSAMTDRRGRFEARFEAVRAAEERRRRRSRLLERVTVLTLLLVPPLVGAWAAGRLGVPVGTGAAVGVVVGAATVVGRRWLARHAQRRGASAWDWQRRRHRLHGDPSRTVERGAGGGPFRPR